MFSVGVFSVLMAIGHGSVSSSGYSMSVKAYKEGAPYRLSVSTIHQKSVDGESLYLDTMVADKYNEMQAAAAKDGFFLKVTTAFRTHKHQRKLKRRKGELAAKPGWSTHQQGLSVDISGTTRKIKGKRYRTILYWWLIRNGKKYGFYNDVEEEPWHWTFKGVNNNEWKRTKRLHRKRSKKARNKTLV